MVVRSVPQKPSQQGEAMPPITKANIENYFTYHPPTKEQIPKYEAIRAAAKTFAEVLVENTPPSADQSAAVRLLRECVMTANASIACGGE
jgi:hypothetical protein